ncbi:MAG: hypothetical protein JWL98_577 [Xanthomonadaceae bacterium]|nr:hypothetical protein [Xanthomonadaceae bacterium]
MRRPLALALFTTGLIASTVAIAGNGGADNPHSANTLIVAVYGDAPYGTTPTDTAELAATPAFIDAINADPGVDLVVHVGDVHSGKQFCTQAYNRAVAALWTAFKDPLIYTPGDNEWSDCHKAAEGGGSWNATTQQVDFQRDGNGTPVDFAGGDPIANLDLVRDVFYPQPGVSLGGRKKTLLSQAQYFDPNHPTDGQYLENVIWVQSKVLFVTINVPGGSNNDQDIWYGAPTMSSRQADEVATRTGATVRWLDQAFALARQDAGIEAVVIVGQADMWDAEKGAAHQAGYEPIVRSIAEHTSAWRKPVLMLNGDSHVYLSDNPLSVADPLHYMHPAYDVSNFHRIVAQGSTFPLEYLRLTIDPRANAAHGDSAFGPFRWERVIQ